MAAQHDRSSFRIGAIPAGEEVAHAVELDGATRPLGPAHEQVPARLVVVGQRLTVGAPRRGSPHLSHVHQPRPEPLRVRVHIRHARILPWGQENADIRASAMRAETVITTGYII